MRNLNLTDTIAAIATPIGESGIGIVRMSGKDALAIADKIFVSKNGRKPSTFKTYTTHYGWIANSPQSLPCRQAGSTVHSPRKEKSNLSTVNCQLSTNVIDEVILTVMRAPRSFTKEDVVEINCHGGIVALRAVLDLVLENGCRLASPGEFTQRAFLNGRIDLAQAEAVLDVIKAKSETALKIGLEQLRGTLSQKINAFSKSLLEILTVLEANIDFPDDEIGSLDLKRMGVKLSEIDSRIKGLLETAKMGQVFREGLHVVICGCPNVGKSSLLNALLKKERSIVTPIAGTTRDTIEEIIDIQGIPVRIVDTAGIIEPRDLVEKKAVLRSRKSMELADLVILMFDGTKRLSKNDAILMRKLKGKPTLAVINKTDLKQKIEKDKVAARFKDVIAISAKRLKNIQGLETAIASLVYDGKVSNSEPVVVSNLRHIQAIREAQKLIAQALNSLDNKLPIELTAQEIKDALGYLDGVLGKRFSEDLLDKIFSDFCIGK